jgi:hypothetical protein
MDVTGLEETPAKKSAGPQVHRLGAAARLRALNAAGSAGFAGAGAGDGGRTSYDSIHYETLSTLK